MRLVEVELGLSRFSTHTSGFLGQDVDATEQVEATQVDAELRNSSVLWVINSDMSGAFIGPGLDATAGGTFPHWQGMLYASSVLRTR